MIQILYMLFV